MTTDIIDSLIEKHQDQFHQSISHPLTNELCQGILPDYKLFTYLIQDLKFFQIGLNLFGKVLALCDDPKPSIVLGKQIGFVSNDENDYFFTCIEQLKTDNLAQLKQYSGKMLLDPAPTLPAVQKYLDFLNYLIFESKSYIELITFMYVMEKVYLGWAEYNEHLIPANLPYKYQEWVRLHSGADFTKWVAFLKSEVVRVVKTDEDKYECEKAFITALTHEIEFFKATYEYKE
ncbi:transcription regulator [Scheffersomyces coipomensis]|uniref:transcription regulator n=1 Tax=Scheffersomyces coipomensis TaxID=1788519 RepID=UPI00315DE064